MQRESSTNSLLRYKANMVDTIRSFSSISVNRNWIIDTGDTDHMTGNRDSLIDVFPNTNRNKFVQLPNRNKLVVTRIGTV